MRGGLEAKGENHGGVGAGDEALLYLDCGDGYATLGICQNSQKYILSKTVSFSVCKF